jgi:hypothetical protein
MLRVQVQGLARMWARMLVMEEEQKQVAEYLPYLPNEIPLHTLTQQE